MLFKKTFLLHFYVFLLYIITHIQTITNPQPCVPFPGVRLWVVTSPVVLQRAGAVPNMDFLLFPRSFPLPEPAGDSVDRPGFPHTRSRQNRVVNKQYRQTGDTAMMTLISLPPNSQFASQNPEIIFFKHCHFFYKEDVVLLTLKHHSKKVSYKDKNVVGRLDGCSFE